MSSREYREMKGVGEGLRNGARLGVEVASPSVVLVLGATWRMEDGKKRSAKRAAVASQARKRKRNGKWGRVGQGCFTIARTETEWGMGQSLTQKHAREIKEENCATVPWLLKRARRGFVYAGKGGTDK